MWREARDCGKSIFQRQNWTFHDGVSKVIWCFELSCSRRKKQHIEVTLWGSQCAKFTRRHVLLFSCSFWVPSALPGKKDRERKEVIVSLFCERKEIYEIAEAIQLKISKVGLGKDIILRQILEHLLSEWVEMIYNIIVFTNRPQYPLSWKSSSFNSVSSKEPSCACFERHLRLLHLKYRCSNWAN